MHEGGVDEEVPVGVHEGLSHGRRAPGLPPRDGARVPLDDVTRLLVDAQDAVRKVGAAEFVVGGERRLRLRGVASAALRWVLGCWSAAGHQSPSNVSAMSRSRRARSVCLKSAAVAIGTRPTPTVTGSFSPTPTSTWNGIVTIRGTSRV